MTADALDHAAAFAHLRRQIQEAASQHEWATRRGIAPTYLSDVLSGRRGFSDALLRAMGLRKVTVFVPVEGRDGALTEEEIALSALSAEETRALLWLPADGTARDRVVRDGGWRPTTTALRRVARAGLARVEEDAGPWRWAATPLGLRAQNIAREAGHG